MVTIILIAGFLSAILLFVWSAVQTAGRCSRAEEEAERKRLEEMRRKEGRKIG